MSTVFIYRIMAKNPTPAKEPKNNKLRKNRKVIKICLFELIKHYEVSRTRGETRFGGPTGASLYHPNKKNHFDSGQCFVADWHNEITTFWSLVKRLLITGNYGQPSGTRRLFFYKSIVANRTIIVKCPLLFLKPSQKIWQPWGKGSYIINKLG